MVLQGANITAKGKERISASRRNVKVSIATIYLNSTIQQVKTMKTQHKVSILALAVIAVMASFAAYSIFDLHKNTGVNASIEASQMTDSATLHTSGAGPSSTSDNSQATDSVQVKTDNVADALGSYNLAPAHYVGIVTYTFKHHNGVVFASYTSHNTRTVQGLQCALTLLFQTGTTALGNFNSSANACSTLIINTSTTHFDGFNTIDLINGSGTVTLNGSDTIATTKIGGSRASTHDGAITGTTSGQGQPQACTPAATTTYNQITCTSGTFTFTTTSGMTIRGALLTNSTSATTTAVFAENAFTGVPVASTDTMTVTWTLTLS